MVTGPPDYVGIGAPRSGSTWWSRQLERHESIPRGNVHKELHWFDRFGTDEHQPEDVEGYHQFFPRRDGEVVGEWTPGYLYQPWTPSLLQASAPDTKLLAILRDPVEQIESSVNYSHTFHGAPDNPLMLTRHVAEAGYHRHLHHWTMQFPAPLLVLQFEHCRDDLDGQLVRTISFLGLDPDPELVKDRKPGTNAGTAKPIQLTARARAALVETLTPDVLALTRDHPSIDPGRWPNFAHLG